MAGKASERESVPSPISCAIGCFPVSDIGESPFPFLHFEDGTKRVLSLDELPFALLELDDYKPTGDGKSPLAKVREWVEIIDPKTGKKA